MEQRRLGRDGPYVSILAQGCNDFGGRLDQSGVDAVVSAAIDSGVTMFDTAESYQQGRSEDLLGKALGSRRKNVLVATKFGAPQSHQTGTPRAGRAQILSACEASLRRLKTDWIDLYQLHAPDPLTPLEETLRALDDLVRAGKVRFIGSSNFAGWQIADAAWTSKVERLTAFVSAQNHYSLIERGVEREVLHAAQAYGVGLLAFYPMAAGLLSGKVSRGAPPLSGSRLALRPDRAARFMTDANFDKIDAVAALAKEAGRTLRDAALAWPLTHSGVTALIVGASSSEQVHSNAASVAWKMPDEVRDAIAKAAAA
jgi:aryl-alcohol dehydrogenase-like predicted oxidoreductase